LSALSKNQRAGIFNDVTENPIASFPISLSRGERAGVRASVHQLIVALAILSTAFVLGCKPNESAQTAATPKPLEPANVKLVQARKGAVNRIVTLPASIAANQQVTLYSKVTGYLKTISVDKGDAVQKGD